MKLLDLVAQLKARLPLFTDLITDTIPVTSVTHAGTTALVITPQAHGLMPGDLVHVSGARTQISVATITHAGGDGIATVTTSEDHDLTFRAEADDRISPLISGANEADFNGTFTLLGVTNRRVFTIQVATSAPAAATGTIILENGASVRRRIEGAYQVQTVPNASELTLLHDEATDLGTMLGTITLRAKPRVGASIEAERVFESFSRGDEDEAQDTRPIEPWVYAVLDDAVVSRGKTGITDATDHQRIQLDWQQTMISPVSIFVALDSSNQTLARNATDQARDLLRPILRSLLGARLDSGLCVGSYGQLQFVGYRLVRYDRAVAWFEYRFEMEEMLTFGDTVGNADDVAFRDIDIQITPEAEGLVVSADHVEIAVDTSLDETPL